MSAAISWTMLYSRHSRERKEAQRQLKLTRSVQKLECQFYDWPLKNKTENFEDICESNDKVSTENMMTKFYKPQEKYLI